MANRFKPDRAPEPPNLTPVVNIAMVVLVVFMLTVSFIEPQRYMQSNVALLEQGGQSNFDEDWTPPTPLPILVNMDAAVPSVFTATVGGQQLSDRDALVALLAEKRTAFESDAGIEAEEVQVEISPQRAVIWQHLITVYEAAQLAGFS
ncbi:MAG: biopolymer transporter ExbD, partial [Planctomycetota bacterium]